MKKDIYLRSIFRGDTFIEPRLSLIYIFPFIWVTSKSPMKAHLGCQLDTSEELPELCWSAWYFLDV